MRTWPGFRDLPFPANLNMWSSAVITARIFADQADYHFYLKKRRTGAKKHGCQIHAYMLMTNHDHLLLTPQIEVAVGKFMQFIGRCYVQYFNYRYRRNGTLWEGRYKTTLLDSERYLLKCYRYVELNSVRAGIVGHPSEYPWSSYAFNALGKANDVVTPRTLYQALGSDERVRQTAYRALFKASIDEKDLREIRETTNKSWVLGSERFKSDVERLLQRQAAPKPRGGDHRPKRSQQLANRD